MSQRKHSAEDAIGKMGTMLLQGWTMLSICCPLCNSPLMKKGSNMNMRCPGCDLPVAFESPSPSQPPGPDEEFEDSELEDEPLEEEEEDPVDAGITESCIGANAESKHGQASSLPPPPPAASLSHTPTGTTSPAAASGPPPGPPNMISTLDSFAEMKREYDIRNASRAKATAKLGELMLQGWTMLGDICVAEDCPGSPLMSSDGNVVCVACDRQYTKLPDGDIVPKLTEKSVDSADAQAKPKKVVESPSTARGSQAANSNTFVDDNQPILPFQRLLQQLPSPTMGGGGAATTSEKMANWLMRGWAMLDEVCQNHRGVPLMRDKDGKKHCVECATTQAAAKTVSLPVSNARTDAKKVPRHEREISYALDDSEDEDEDGDDALAFERYAQQRLESATQAVSNVDQGESVVTTKATSGAVMAHLLKAMETLAARVERSAQSTDLSQCAAQVALLKEIASVAADIKAI